LHGTEHKLITSLTLYRWERAGKIEIIEEERLIILKTEAGQDNLVSSLFLRSYICTGYDPGWEESCQGDDQPVLK
jgi:predicted site-specific integrase-resolvase